MRIPHRQLGGGDLPRILASSTGAGFELCARLTRCSASPYPRSRQPVRRRSWRRSQPIDYYVSVCARPSSSRCSDPYSWRWSCRPYTSDTTILIRYSKSRERPIRLGATKNSDRFGRLCFFKQKLHSSFGKVCELFPLRNCSSCSRPICSSCRMDESEAVADTDIVYTVEYIQAAHEIH